MSRSPGSGPDDGEPRRRPGADRVVPAWVVIPLAAGAGFLTAGWPGMAFGLFVGAALWKLRD